MEAGFLLKGLIIGFSIAAPVGPIGVLCIRRTVAGGFIRGVTAGLGTAVADAVYGSVAAFGFTAVTSFLVDLETPLRLVGGAFLCFLGCRIFMSRPEVPADRSGKSEERRGDAYRPPGGKGPARYDGLFGGFVSTFALTITNPITILAFTAVFAGVGLAATPNNYGSAAFLVAGVFSGSALWWLTLCAATSFFRKMMDARTMKIINVISGIVIAGFGVYSIVSAL
jgi:threonine/homoserine/homoserine lactone efflux protein